MGERYKTASEVFEEAVSKREPTDAELKVVDRVVELYNNLRGGTTRKCVTHATKLFINGCLPKLTLDQALELNAFVHTMIETTLSYLVEDGLIKGE